MRRLPWVRVGVSVALGVVLTLVMAWVVPVAFIDADSGTSDSIVVDQPPGAYGNRRHTWCSAYYRLVWIGNIDSRESRGIVKGEPVRAEPTELYSVPHWVTIPDVSESDTVLTETGAFGFPFLCMTRQFAYDRTTKVTTHLGLLRVPVPMRVNENGYVLLAQSPLLWGWLGNVVVLSGLVFGVIGLPISVRTAHRWRCGLCTACGYDLAGVTDRPCPECGREHRKSRRGLATGG